MVLKLMGLFVLATCVTTSACRTSATTWGNARAVALREAERPSTLQGTDGLAHDIAPRGPEPYVVLVFFSPECPGLRAHHERLRQLASTYGDRGLRFWGVDSEVGATLARDRAEAAAGGFPFPILLDPGARLARALGAEYAGYVVVLDARGAARYRGGIDSDRIRLRDDRVAYLDDALADLLAGRPPRRPETKSLGCALRTW